MFHLRVFVYLLGRQLTDRCFGGASLHPAYLMAWGIPMAPKPSKAIIWWCNHSESIGKTTIAIFSSQPLWRCIFLPQWFGGLWLWLRLKHGEAQDTTGQTCRHPQESLMPSPAWMVDLSSTMPACTRTWWNCCWDQRKVPAPTTTVWWWIKDGLPRCWWNHNIQVEHLNFADVEIYLFQDGFNPIILPSFSPSSELGFPMIPGLWTTTISPLTTPLGSRPTTRRSTRARRGSWCWTRWRGSRGRWWCGPAMVGMWGMEWGW